MISKCIIEWCLTTFNDTMSHMPNTKDILSLSFPSFHTLSIRNSDQTQITTC